MAPPHRRGGAIAMSDDEEDGMAKTLAERFWEKVAPDESTGCLVWTAAGDGWGYGHVWCEGRMLKAHRVAWYLAHDEWPEHTLDHLCRNRACVNVDHLEDVPHAENIRRGRAGSNWSDRTHCGNGHEFTPENTYRRKNGGRQCRECDRERNRRDYHAKKAKALA